MGTSAVLPVVDAIDALQNVNPWSLDNFSSDLSPKVVVSVIIPNLH